MMCQSISLVLVLLLINVAVISTTTPTTTTLPIAALNSSLASLDSYKNNNNSSTNNHQQQQHGDNNNNNVLEETRTPINVPPAERVTTVHYVEDDDSGLVSPDIWQQQQQQQHQQQQQKITITINIPPTKKLTTAYDDGDDIGLDLPDIWPLWWKILHGILCCGQILSAAYAIFFICALFTTPPSSSATLLSSSSKHSTASRASCASSSSLSSTSSRRGRKSSGAFNVHLIFLVIPDALLNMVGIGSSIVGIYNNGRQRPWYIYLNVWITMFYFCSNFVLNAVVANEIHSLVRKSYRGIRIRAFSIVRTYVQIGCVYAFAALSATWCTVETPWSLMTMTDPIRGVAAFGSPSPNGVFSSQTTLILFFSVISLPTAYVLYVRWSISRYFRLVSSSSLRTRVFSLYFLRILIVFFGFYFPNIICAVLRTRSNNIHTWFLLKNVRIFLEALQPIVTIRIACQKKDVGTAVEQFYQKQRENIQYYSCCWNNNDNIDDNDEYNDTTFVMEEAASYHRRFVIPEGMTEEGTNTKCTPTNNCGVTCNNTMRNFLTDEALSSDGFLTEDISEEVTIASVHANRMGSFRSSLRDSFCSSYVKQQQQSSVISTTTTENNNTDGNNHKPARRFSSMHHFLEEEALSENLSEDASANSNYATRIARCKEGNDHSGDTKKTTVFRSGSYTNSDRSSYTNSSDDYYNNNNNTMILQQDGITNDHYDERMLSKETQNYNNTMIQQQDGITNDHYDEIMFSQETRNSIILKIIEEDDEYTFLR